MEIFFQLILPCGDVGKLNPRNIDNKNKEIIFSAVA